LPDSSSKPSIEIIPLSNHSLRKISFLSASISLLLNNIISSVIPTGSSSNIICVNHIFICITGYNIMQINIWLTHIILKLLPVGIAEVMGSNPVHLCLHISVLLFVCLFSYLLVYFGRWRSGTRVSLSSMEKSSSEYWEVSSA